jgi:hypothetical protein
VEVKTARAKMRRLRCIFAVVVFFVGEGAGEFDRFADVVR